jgi:hypothetical protein
MQSVRSHYNRLGTLIRAQISNRVKVEYTDNSRLNRLRLEDSFLPGALQKPYIAAFRDTAYSTRNAR